MEKVHDRCSETCSETGGELVRLKGDWWGKPNRTQSIAVSGFPHVFNTLGGGVWNDRQTFLFLPSTHEMDDFDSIS